LENSKPKWLTKLQQNSWEPEILLSGIVLYGLFKLPGILDDLLYFIKVNSSSSTTDVDNFISLMKVAVYWVITGLILHLISRGIWVGMVGLSFTFPKGIDYGRLKLSSRYHNFLGKIPTTQQIILNLESFSSSLFSISFMAFMIMIGAYIYLFVLIIIPVLLLIYVFDINLNNETNGIILASYLVPIVIIGLIGFIDFITLGWIKKIKWLSRIYWPIYRFIGFFTVARAYRSVYYTLLSNISRWKIAFFFVIFTVVSFQWIDSTQDDYFGDSISQIELWSNSIGTGSFTGYYDDQMDEKKSIYAHIQSDIIRGNTVRLFVVLHAEYEDSIRSYCNYDSIRSIDGMSSAQAKLDCLADYYQVSIDDSLYSDLEYRFHYKSLTKQKGILTYIDISDLPNGLHEVKVLPPKRINYRNIFANIPFYKEEVIQPYFVPETSGKELEQENYMKIKPLLPK
jgi:hypothetical protein